MSTGAFGEDLRFALRQSRRAPGFAVTAVTQFLDQAGEGGRLGTEPVVMLSYLFVDPMIALRHE